MKRLVLILMGVALACVSAMAQTTPAAAPGSSAAGGTAATAWPKPMAPAAATVTATTPAKAADTSKALTGTVDSVTAADAAKSVAANVTVTDKAGLKYLLTVKDTTTIYNDKSEAISLDKIVAGQKVHVKYNGTNNEAVSIRVAHAHSAASSAAPSVTP